MKTVELHKLTLHNFKGFTYTLAPEGENLDVYGQNGLGKTTLADAWCWLLTGKDSRGQGDGKGGFDVKPRNSDGSFVHKLDQYVEALVSVDGTMVMLKRLYREVWSRKRGNATEELSGHKTEYFQDGGPDMGETKYKALIAQLFGDEEVMRLVTNPMAFPSLPWQKQRQIVFTVAGDIPDSDIIAANRELYDLPGVLKGKTIEDHKKLAVSRRAEIKKDLEAVPVRIDEVRRTLPDVSGLNLPALQAEAGQLEESLSSARLRLSGIDNGATITELSKELAGLVADISRLEQNYHNDALNIIRGYDAQIADLENKESAAARRSTSVKSEIAYKTKEIGTLEVQAEAKRKEWAAVNAEEFQDGTPDQCAACGQFLPADRVEQARDRARAQFNTNKSTRLEQIITKGKDLSERVKILKEEIDRLTEETTGGLNEEEQAQLADLRVKRNEVKGLSTDYTKIQERAPLIEQKTELDRLITAARETVQTDKEKARGEVDGLEIGLKDTKAKAALFVERQRGEKRIEELKTQEKELASEYERLEREVYLCELFTRTKVNFVTDRINGKFQLVKFKLFNLLANGNEEDCCEITLNGVGWNNNLNSAARINAGMDVCRTLADHYGLCAPIFCDNAETVCELLPVEAQVIRLIVSEKDAALRVERAEKRRVAA